MFGNTFCTICGAQISPRNTYCSKCGVTLVNEMNITFAREHQNHCTGCGSRVSPRDYYCANCGVDSQEYYATVPQRQVKQNYPSGGSGIL